LNTGNCNRASVDGARAGAASCWRDAVTASAPAPSVTTREPVTTISSTARTQEHGGLHPPPGRTRKAGGPKQGEAEVASRTGRIPPDMISWKPASLFPPQESGIRVPVNLVVVALGNRAAEPSTDPGRSLSQRIDPAWRAAGQRPGSAAAHRPLTRALLSIGSPKSGLFSRLSWPNPGPMCPRCMLQSSDIWDAYPTSRMKLVNPEAARLYLQVARGCCTAAAAALRARLNVSVIWVPPCVRCCSAPGR